MSDKDKLEMLLSHTAPCIETLGGKAISFQSEPPELEMLDAPMAHLLIALLEGEFYPMTRDINVSFLGPSHPGKLICNARILKQGRSIVYLASELYQKEKLVASATSTVKLVSKSS